jgi:glycosyltransferase involved in cell wall biosynthesis
MSASPHHMPVLMIAYTNYRTDPRVIREAEAAVKGGFDVDFIALRREDDPPEEMIRGVRIIHLDQLRYRGANKILYVLSYLEFFFRCLLKTTWLHLRKRYRVVHVNNMPDFFVFCAVVPKLMGAKVLLDIHDPMPNTFASKFRRGEAGALYRLLLWQERVCAWFADRVLTVHEPVKAYILVEQHGLRADEVEVIANFADDELFRLRQPAPAIEDRLRLVFHGSILERYGLRDLMQAIARMRHKDRISVRIIGEGDFSAELKALIAGLDLQDVVEFDNRMYPLHDIPGMLQGYHVGLVPLEISSITNYALPLKLLEYLSLGMPSITVRSVAIGHYFGSDDCLFYQPDQPETLTAVLDQLAEDPDLVRRYQARAEALRERFTWSGEQRKYIALLHSLANPA